MELKHVIGSATAMSFMLAQGGASHASGAIPARMAVAGQCETYDGAPIFQADARRGIKGRIRICETGMIDLTPAPYAARPGERLFLSACNFQARKTNGIIRGKMNTPYVVNTAIDYENDMTSLDAKPGLKWALVSRVPPFVPTKIYNLGRQKGRTLYGYGGIVALPSKASFAHPLNSNSVIVSIDGCGFSSPDTLVGMMAAPGGKSYIEVNYYQANERNGVLRRAFIPTFERRDVTTEWQSITTKYPTFEPDRSGRIMAAAAFMTVAGLTYLFANSEMGKQLAREREACRARDLDLIIC